VICYRTVLVVFGILFDRFMRSVWRRLIEPILFGFVSSSSTISYVAQSSSQSCSGTVTQVQKLTQTAQIEPIEFRQQDNLERVDLHRDTKAILKLREIWALLLFIY